MASKHFTFFLGQNDQAEFEQALRTSGEIAFLKVWPNSPGAEELPTSVVSVMGKDILNLWIVRREDVGGIEFTPIRVRDVFSCDPIFEPVVEFGRCYATERFIRPGRLYKVNKYWNESRNLVRKSRAFVSWSDRLYGLAKESLTKIERGCYAGAEALALRKAGVAFEGLDIAVGSISS